MPESYLSPNEKSKYTIVNSKPISKQTQHGRLEGYFTIRFPALQNCLIIPAVCTILPIVRITDFQPGNKGPATEKLTDFPPFFSQLMGKCGQLLIKSFPVKRISKVTKIASLTFSFHVEILHKFLCKSLNVKRSVLRTETKCALS